MNINFGMNNFYTRYLKRFLSHRLKGNTGMLGEFTKNDLRELIKYLNMPNTETVFEVKKQLLNATRDVVTTDDFGNEVIKKELLFPKLEELFTITVGNDELVFTSKRISTETSMYLQNNINAIKDFCKNLGWELGDVYNWIDTSYDVNNDGVINETDKRVIEDIIYRNMHYSEDIMRKADINLDGVVDENDLKELDTYIEEKKIYFTLRSNGQENLFPNKDMLVFVNQFDGDFLENYAIRDDDGMTDVVHPHAPDAETGISTKIGLYKCKPGQKLTIAHGGNSTAHLVIGSCDKVLKQNILENEMLKNVVEIDLEPGESYEYTTTVADDVSEFGAQWLCIQCPSDYSNISSSTTKKVYLDVGDINFDGRIDMEDYNMLAQYTAEGAGAETLPWNKANWTPTDKQLAVMNCRTDNEWHRERIDTDDAVILYNYINNIGGITDLGLTPWDITKTETSTENVNVSNLLIIDGHYDSSVNIPYSEFTTNPWIIHDKFFNYLFGMAVHKYSNSEDITYVQKLLSEINSDIDYSNIFTLGIYDDKMKEVTKAFQSSKMNYTTGDLNRDNKLDNKDLTIMRQFVNDCSDYTKVCKYLDNPEENPLSRDEIMELDRDGDGKITETDKIMIKDEIDSQYSPVLQSRADIDENGYIEESDYNYLMDIINNGYTYIEKKIKKDDGTYDVKTIYCDLKNREIPFQLGWLDVQTEALLEFENNNMGLISEVTK